VAALPRSPQRVLLERRARGVAAGPPPPTEVRRGRGRAGVGGGDPPRLSAPESPRSSCQ
jgi:hypothetical protein